MALGTTGFRGWWRKSSPLAGAFALSLAIHLSLLGLLEITARLGLWDDGSWLRRLHPAARREATPRADAPMPSSPPEPSVALIFVDVAPSQATEQAPKDTPFYSTLNSQAANPEADREAQTPKVDGEQTHVVKATDTPLPPPTPPPAAPLQPAPPIQSEDDALPEVAEATPAARPAPRPPPGDLAMAKPAPRPPPDANDESSTEVVPMTPAARPRRLADLPQSLLAGRKMKLDGGVRRVALEPSFDVRRTEFGSYDAAIIAAIQHRWYGLLENNEYARDRTGKVVLEFRLNHDGRITQMRVVENTVGEILSTICQRAVLDPSPFREWPAEMRRLVGNTYRNVRFTFYYN
jgi:hypothetical protein